MQNTAKKRQDDQLANSLNMSLTDENREWFANTQAALKTQFDNEAKQCSDIATQNQIFR